MCFYACYCYYFYLARVLRGGVNIHRIVFSWNAYCSLCFKVEVILVTQTHLHTNPLMSENKLHLLSFCFWRSQFGFTLAIPLYPSASLMKIESNLFRFNIKSWKCKTKSHRCLRHVPVTLIKSNHKFLTIPVSWNHKLLSFKFSHQKIQTNKLHPTNPFGIHTSLSSSRFPKAEKKNELTRSMEAVKLTCPSMTTSADCMAISGVPASSPVQENCTQQQHFH